MTGFKRSLTAVILACSCLATSAAWADEAEAGKPGKQAGKEPTATTKAASPIGRKITDFTLRDFRGQERSLSQWKNHPVVVVVFLGTECPLARLYAPRLTALAEHFGGDAAFVGINSNSQDSITEIAGYANRHEVSFPILKDTGNRVADQFGAVRTPEVFVLDKDRVVRYWGRIDDQYGVGVARDKVRNEELKAAVTELLAGKPVSTLVTESVGCYIGREQKTKPRGEITYSKHIAPIFNSRCVECHREGEIAPFPLTSFADTEGWGDTIVEVIADNRMPPWSANPAHGQFKNDARLTDRERELINTWVENGMPEGDRKDLPEPPTFVDGWRIPEPDQIVYMRDKPFTVPAEGVVSYKYFEVDPGFKEDKYIWAAEARPDNRAVVHHIIVYIRAPGTRDFRRLGSIDGYAPGSQPTVFRDGLAKFVPAGSKFVFEMHYTPNGAVQKDRSYVGFKFLAKDKVKNVVRGGMAINTRFRIPAGDDNYRVTSSRRIREDVDLLTLTPHMHLRGKAFRYEVRFPDGREDVLLDVPRYDFNWQLTYELAKPLRLPRGTEIFCTARFDNSEFNPSNPNPNRRVGWGDQSFDEMMIGFFDYVPATPKVPESEPIRRAAAKPRPLPPINLPPINLPPVDPAGVWKWDFPRGDKVVKNELTLRLDGKTLKGTYKGSGDPVEIESTSWDGHRLAFEVPIEFGSRTVRVEFTGRVKDDVIVGNATLSVGRRSIPLPWAAKR